MSDEIWDNVRMVFQSCGASEKIEESSILTRLKIDNTRITYFQDVSWQKQFTVKHLLECTRRKQKFLLNLKPILSDATNAEKTLKFIKEVVLKDCKWNFFKILISIYFYFVWFSFVIPLIVL